MMSHCHCSRCRKTHGAPFATYFMVPLDGYSATGTEHVVRYASSPGFARSFCGVCGSVVPAGPWESWMLLPAGSSTTDPGLRPEAHIFVASKLPWHEITDDLPRFDAYPPGIPAAVLEDLPAAAPAGGGARGSCMCGEVAWVLEGKPTLARNCHCSRCRLARSAAHASNLMAPSDALRVTRGADRIGSYKIPDAQFFTQTFCRTCGGKTPRHDASRGIAVAPLACFDDDPGIRPQMHIFVGSKAPWFEITDALPQHAGPPPT
jgi:hypothetical protein